MTIKIKNKRNKKGYAFTIVLIVMVVLSILFVAAYTVINSNTRQIVYQENKLRAHYLARSGANLAYTAIADNLEEFLKDPNNDKYNSESNAVKDTIEFNKENAEALVSAWQDSEYIYIKSKSKLKSSDITSEIRETVPGTGNRARH